MVSHLKRDGLPSILTWLLCLFFFGPFLLYPLYRVAQGALIDNGAFAPGLLLLPWKDHLTYVAVRNSLVIGVLVTLLATVISVPLAYATVRLRFSGKGLLTGMLLVPLLLPPFVGAVGLRQMLGREGVVNLLLQQWRLTSQPIDFLQLALPMVVLVAAFHLYPLIYLNLTAAWANVDPALEEAAENQGATPLRLFRSVTLPLLLPGYLAGALIVFIFAFTDLGTPLVFNFRQVAAVRIFDARENISDPTGYVLGFWLTLMAGAFFWIARRYLNSGRISTTGRSAGGGRERSAPLWSLPLVYGCFLVVIGIALLPHIGVLLSSFAHDWTNRVLPEWTAENYRRIVDDPQSLATTSIKISLLCALLSMTIDIVAGFALAYALVRGRIWGAALLDTLAMLPLALPGLILAFGLLVGYTDTRLDPAMNAIPLLVISYALRRLPYALRSVSAGLQQTSVTLEEASANLGATKWQTLWQVTRPLVMANLLAAGLLTFAFAVLEVSDSLILAADANTMPLAKAIYQLTLMTSGGTYLACALGVIGMVLLTVTFLLANRLLGRQLGALFRV